MGNRPDDPEGAMRLLDDILEKHRSIKVLPEQTRVLLILSRPFRSGNNPVARLSLETFERMDSAFKPGDVEEALERWRWLLKAMEIEDPELRVRALVLLGFISSDLPAPSRIRRNSLN